MIHALQDQNTQIRRYAVRALGEIGDSRGLKPLEKRLKRETNLKVTQEIKKAIQRIKQAKTQNPTGSLPMKLFPTELYSAL